MMTYDPFQTYANFPNIAPQMNPAAGLNPLAATLGLSSLMPNAGFGQGGFPQSGIQQIGIPQGGNQQMGQPVYGGHSQQLQNSQQLQLATLLASQLLQAALQNPQLAAALQNQLGQQQQLGSPYGQQLGLPYGQQPQQIGSPWQQQLYGQQQPFNQQQPFGQQQQQPYGQQQLAPQSWVGQPGLFGGQPYGQVHPLAYQLGARPFQTPGISPWGY